MSLADLLTTNMILAPPRAPTRAGSVKIAPFMFNVQSMRVTREKFFGEGDGWHVELVIQVFERDGNGLARLTFRQDFRQSDAPTEHAAVRALLLQALTHEADECLLVDGVRINDPHAKDPVFR